jgi:uncharacterized damage-inducible protein DinB
MSEPRSQTPRPGAAEESTLAEIPVAFVAKSRALLMSEYLPKIERCLEQLDDAQVWWRAAEESNSIGNLILHLSGNARQWVVSGMRGAPDRRARQSEFDRREVMPRAELLALLKGTLAEVDEVLARLDTSLILERRLIQGHEVSILEALFHVVEHFSMHTGQIILLTKMLAGKELGFYDFSSGAPVANWQRK